MFDVKPLPPLLAECMNARVFRLVVELLEDRVDGFVVIEDMVLIIELLFLDALLAGDLLGSSIVVRLPAVDVEVVAAVPPLVPTASPSRTKSFGLRNDWLRRRLARSSVWKGAVVIVVVVAAAVAANDDDVDGD